MKRVFVFGVAVTLLCTPVAAQKAGTARKSAPPKKAAALARPQPAPPRAERPVPFRPGESLVYDVSWSSFVTAGTATVTVREKKASYNSVAYYIVAEGKPTPLLSHVYTLYYKADTLLDAYALLPQRGSVFSQENSRRRMKVTLFDQGARKIHYEMRTTNLLKQDKPVPPDTQDALSAIYDLRAMPLKPGMTLTFPISDSGTTYSAWVRVDGRETVTTGLGDIQALKLTPVIRDPKGQAIGRGLTVWMSDDARKLPVKMSAQLTVGSFNLTLREAR